MSYNRCPYCQRTLTTIDELTGNKFCVNVDCIFMYVNMKTGEFHVKDGKDSLTWLT